MTPERQRIEIAEACGYRRDKRDRWRSPLGHYYEEQTPPDYLNDLNAMHEAEKVLTAEQAWQYVQILAVDGDGWCATAAKRAKAFLLTLGIWKD